MRRGLLFGLLLALTLLLTATPAKAQTVNPKSLEWDTADHALTTRYELGYYLGSATSPVQTVSIAPTAVSSVDADTFRTPLPRPILGTFTARLRACGPATGGGEVCSDWSNATDPFVSSLRVPVLRVVP